VKATFLKGVVLGSVVSGVTLISSVALAGTGVGGVFNLGQTNSVNASTVLTGSTNGKQLQVTNTNTGASAAGIGISVASGKPPLVVSSSTKVSQLNADLLDGLDSSKLQRRVTGACANGTAISSVLQSGAVICTSAAVFPIDQSPPSGSQSYTDFLPSHLALFTICHEPSTEVVFYNYGSSVAPLNWMFSQGGTTSTVNATGASVDPGTNLAFTFPGGRLEGQWIFAEPGVVTTLNLHAFDGGSSCEVRGTAEVATP